MSPELSAKSHVQGRCTLLDPLTDMHAINGAVDNWRAMLRHGLEAGDVTAAGKAVADAIEARLRTGRPLAAEEWIAQQEAQTGKQLHPGKRGPKPKVVRVNPN